MLVSPFIPYWLRPKAQNTSVLSTFSASFNPAPLHGEQLCSGLHPAQGLLTSNIPTTELLITRPDISDVWAQRGSGGLDICPLFRKWLDGFVTTGKQIERAGWTALTFNLWDKQRQKKKSWCVLVTKAHDEWKSYSLCEWFLLLSKISLFYQSVGALCFISAYKWQ